MPEALRSADGVPRIIYIVGMGHSGSTLLDLLISSHSQVASVGEAKQLNPREAPTARCGCVAGLVWECPFWDAVSGDMEHSASVSLRQLDLQSKDDTTFACHNRAFFDAVRKQTGKSLVVDSSKNSERFARLLASGDFEVFPVHLIRRPQGIVYSQIKRGRGLVRHCQKYSQRIQRARELLRDQDHFVVRYEDLATDPERVLSELMPRVGLEFEQTQLNWGQVERHDCGGNRMRLTRSSEIRIDRDWETGLQWWQKLTVDVLTRRNGS